MPYQFAYSVSDSASYNEYGHQETSDGNLVKGEYRVLLPDGRTQIVSYYVEGDSGFVAEVRYEGEVQYQEKNKPYEQHTPSFQSKSPVGPSYYPTQTVTYSPKVNIYHHPSEIPKINNEESIGSGDYPSKSSYQRPANNKTSSSQDISSNLVTSSNDELKGRPLGVNKPIPSYQNKPSDSENFHGRPHDGYTPYEQPSHAIRPPMYDQRPMDEPKVKPLNVNKPNSSYKNAVGDSENFHGRPHDGYTPHDQPSHITIRPPVLEPHPIDELKVSPLSVNIPTSSYKNALGEAENFHGRPHDGYTPYEHPSHITRPPVFEQHPIDELKVRPLIPNTPISSYKNTINEPENFHGRPHDGYTPFEQPAHAIRPPVYDQHSVVYSPLPEKDHGEYHESDRYRYHDGYTIHHQPPSDAIYRSVSPHTRPIHYYADPYSHYHQHDDRFYVEEARRPSILPHEGYSHHYGHSALMEHPHYPNTYVHIEYPTIQGYNRPSDHHPLLSLGSIPHQQFNPYGHTPSLDKNKSKRRI